MLTKEEKLQLTEEVEHSLLSIYKVNPDDVKKVSDVVLGNWFVELETEGSHLSADLIAANITDIAKRYVLA